MKILNGKDSSLRLRRSLELVGRLVYNESLPGLLSGEYLINAIDLGESFSSAEEFQIRIDACET